MSETTTRTEYRIVSRPPNERRYKFRQFTNSTHHDPAAIRRIMARAEQESPGWSFRIESRTITTTTTDWVTE